MPQRHPGGTGRAARLLKDLPVRIAGFRPVEEAIVTAGGVALKEIDAKTMASKKLPGLFLPERCWT